MVRLVDVHCHLYEFKRTDIDDFKDMLILAVSDDYESSRKTLELADEYSNVIPAVGLHPWLLSEVNPKEELKRISKLINNYDVRVLGEIGLDKKFTPETFNKQLEVFRELLALAKDYDLKVNLHAAGAWREVYDEVLSYDIDSVLFHWYTGPLDLLEEIISQGFFISINPAIKIQDKHRKVLEYAKIDHILTESDGPYNYRGLKLTPKMVEELVKSISILKNLPLETVKTKIFENFTRYVGVRRYG